MRARSGENVMRTLLYNPFGRLVGGESTARADHGGQAGVRGGIITMVIVRGAP